MKNGYHRSNLKCRFAGFHVSAAAAHSGVKLEVKGVGDKTGKKGDAGLPRLLGVSPKSGSDRGRSAFTTSDPVRKGGVELFLTDVGTLEVFVGHLAEEGLHDFLEAAHAALETVAQEVEHKEGRHGDHEPGGGSDEHLPDVAGAGPYTQPTLARKEKV